MGSGESSGEAVGENLDEDLDSLMNDISKNNGIIKTNDLSASVKFYQLENGNCPVKDFLNSISDKKLKAKTERSIAMLAMFGRGAKKPLVDYVGDGIYELRTIQSNNLTRIFYFFPLGDLIILTNGYVKKTQKLDTQEFELAKKYREDFSRRNLE